MWTSPPVSIRLPKYLFIDGGQLREHFVKALKGWEDSVTPMDIDFSALISSAMATKSFYYDCHDEQQLPKEYFSGIRQVSGSHVRLGTLKGKSNKRAPRQKEVDILLAVDMMNHAFRQNMREAILLSGDMDFLPVVETLVEIGCFVTVMADKKHVAEDLKDAADDFREITFKDYYAWSSQRIKSKRLPDMITRPPLHPTQQGFKLVKKGKCRGQLVELYIMEGEQTVNPQYYIYQPDYSFHSTEPVFHYQFGDLERLEYFFKLQYEPIEWESSAETHAAK